MLCEAGGLDQPLVHWIHGKPKPLQCVGPQKRAGVVPLRRPPGSARCAGRRWPPLDPCRTRRGVRRPVRGGSSRSAPLPTFSEAWRARSCSWPRCPPIASTSNDRSPSMLSSLTVVLKVPTLHPFRRFLQYNYIQMVFKSTRLNLQHQRPRRECRSWPRPRQDRTAMSATTWAAWVARSWPARL